MQILDCIICFICFKYLFFFSKKKYIYSKTLYLLDWNRIFKYHFPVWRYTKLNPVSYVVWITNFISVWKYTICNKVINNCSSNIATLYIYNLKNHYGSYDILKS